MAQEKIEIRDLRQKDQFILDDAFLNGYAKFVGIYAVGVYCSFCRHANKEQTSWPSIETISDELGIGRTSVIEAIKRLEFWGTVVKIRVGKMANNRYVLTSKKTWREISEVSLTDFSEVCDTDFSSLRDRLHKSATRTSNSKELKSKELKERNADSLRSSDVPFEKVDVPDEDTVARPKADPLVEKAAKYWQRLCQEEVGVSPSGGLPKSMKVIKEARKSLTFNEIQQMMKAWFDEQTLEPHEMIQITRCLSAFQVDKFKAENT